MAQPPTWRDTGAGAGAAGVAAGPARMLAWHGKKLAITRPLLQWISAAATMRRPKLPKPEAINPNRLPNLVAMPTTDGGEGPDAVDGAIPATAMVRRPSREPIPLQGWK